MFSTVRPNSQIFILSKGQNPVLETASVVSVSAPRIAQMMNPPQQYPPPMVVDIVAQVGNDKRNLTGLPSDKDIFDYMGNMVITCDRNLMDNELRMLEEQQENIIKAHDSAKELVKAYRSMRTSLNPEAAENAILRQKLSAMEESLAQQAEINRMVMEQLRNMSGQSGKSDGAKPSKNTKENA